MKIYLVMEDCDYDGVTVRGVFETAEKAAEAKARMGLREDNSVDEWEVDDPATWPAGRPYRLEVTEYPGAPAQAYGFQHDDFRARDSEWEHKMSLYPVYRSSRVHTRIVWCGSQDEAIDMAAAKAAELQQLPFDRETP